MTVNIRAAKTDEAYAAACRAQGYLRLGYYFHDIDVLWTSAEMAGNYGITIDAARRVVKAETSFPHALQWDGPMNTALLTNLRFGKWGDVLDEPRPDAKWTLTAAMWLYAEGFAAANLHDFDRAKKDRSDLAGMVAANAFAGDEPKGNSHLQMAETGLALLDGEIARLNGHIEDAVADFRKARDLEQVLPYGEPPTWHQPVSHILGAALLEARRPADAEAVYRDSLKYYRADGWALFGLAEALDMQGRQDAASRVREEFARAWRLSDVTLTSSRFQALQNVVAGYLRPPPSFWPIRE